MKEKPTIAEQHITADKREIKDFPNYLRQLLLSASRYMKWWFSPF